MWLSARLFFSALAFAMGIPVISVAAPSEDQAKAYALNQEAMVDMSMAQFDSAADKFIEAAELISDYKIKDQSLRYTPNFMAAWAYEKIGDAPKACRYFKKFIEVATIEDREQTKTDHAENYLGRHCRSMPPHH